jgi:hypothetical protein
MVSEKYEPTRDGYPKTTTLKYNSCGDANSWISEQFNIDTYKDVCANIKLVPYAMFGALG